MADEEKTLLEEEEQQIASPGGPDWLKRYPPLTAIVVALLITVLVLPSALNLPQSNPSTVLEYAPVPPEDDSPPPTSEGSISALGLGSSGTLRTSITPDVPKTQGATGPGKGENPITKQCVGSPARQTDDPNAPPCVPFFEGDNGGITWQGVTGEEIIVIIYADGYCTDGSRSGTIECTPAGGSYCDIDTAPDSQPTCQSTDYGAGEPLGYDHHDVAVYRAFSKYFNERFQTYNRHVHFVAFFTQADSPPERRAEAADNWDRLKPFAVLQRPQFGGFDDIYTESMVKRRVMSFGALPPRPNAYYKEFSPPKYDGGMIWNFWPDVEHWADNYVSYICQRVKQTSNVVQGSKSRPPAINNQSIVGQPRKYGFMRTTDPRFPQFQYMAELVKSGTEQCGIKYAETADFSRHQYSVDSHPDAVTEADENVSKFESAEITTIISGSGYETEHGKAMEARQYYPEIFVVDDQWHGSITKARFQNQTVWRNAVLMSNKLLEDKQENSPCRQAYRETDPSGTFFGRACEVYHDFFMLFKAIQVAGPILGPDTVDSGQHAIPAQDSTSPYVAACYFDPGDYTCVKDAREAWWDADAPDPDGDPDERGCWRLTNGGDRSLAQQWGTGYYAFQNPQDVCDNQGNDYDINPYGIAG